MVEIRVLGSVDVVDDDGEQIALRGPMPVRLLALLVAARPAAVSVNDLVAQMWEDADPPDDPVASLRTYVTRARAAVGKEGVITGSGTYRLGDVTVDADRFEAFVTRARQSSMSPAVDQLWKSALDLWRGGAFGDLGALDAIRPVAARLDELRAEATEAWFDARLAAGEARELAGDLNAAVVQFPLREGLRVQQVTMLARAGRQADALRAFQDFRADLTEIGLEPSARLAELDQRVAAGEIPRDGARRTLRGYEIGERLGEGAFAIVHRARQTSVDRDVAIKQIRGSLADQPEFIRGFEAEAAMVARLEHPHIVPLYDFWREPGSAYLVMRHLDGGNLAERIRSSGPMDADEVARIITQVAAALDEAHRSEVVHRDVKPANILLDHTGNAYLSDFGIAVDEAARVDPAAWLSHGSPAYASPEQVLREPVGPAADVFSLGVTVYELLTGQVPFPTETTMAGLVKHQIEDPVPLVRSSRPDLAAAIDTVIQRATSKVPEERHATAGELATELALAAGLDSDEALITAEERNPYKGLRPFDEADAGDFTGRDRLVNQLLRALQTDRAVLVVGPSGAGKSSVVRAGLLPALRAGRLPESASWYVTTMIPGARPFEDLEAALARVAVEPPVDLAASVRSDPGRLARVIEQIVPDDRELVLVVDQFEELFTMAEPSVANRFLDALVEAITAQSSRIRLIATLRADFYDRPLRHKQLAALIDTSTIAVQPLAPDELEQAITFPARAVGCAFEPGLIAEISAEVSDQPGALPLLQHTLAQLYERRVDNVMTKEAYSELGRVSGALARTAEEIHDTLDDGQRAAARRVFGRLVTLGEGTEDTRRRVLRSELGDGQDVVAVLGSYGTARLLSFDRDETTREPTVEVAHEAIIREWPRLREWLDDDRDGLRINRQLTASAESWDGSARDVGELLSGGRLEVTEGWATENADELSALEEEFLVESVNRRVAQAEAERRSQRRIRRALVGVAAVAVVAVLAGVLAFQQQRTASANAVTAENERLAADAAALAGDDPPLSLLLGVEAFRRDSGPIGLGALQQALSRAGSFLGIIAVEGAEGVRWLDDERLAVTGSSGTWVIGRDGSRQQLSDTPVLSHFIQVGDGNTRTVSVLGAAGDVVVSARRDEPQLVDVWTADGELVTTVEHSSAVDAIEVSADGAAFYTLGFDGWLRALDGSDGSEFWRVHAHPETTGADVEWPADGVDVFYGFPREVVRADYSLRLRPQLIELGSDGIVHTVEGGLVRRWDASTGSQVGAEVMVAGLTDAGLVVPAAVDDIVVAEDGTRVTAAIALSLINVPLEPGVSGTSLVVETSTAFYATPKTDRIWQAADGRVLVSFTDGRLEWVDGSTGKLLPGGLDTGLTGVVDMMVSPSGGTVAVTSDDGVGMWSLVGDGLIASGLPRLGTHMGHLLGDDIVAANYSRLFTSDWAPAVWWDDSEAQPLRIETPADELSPDFGVGFRWGDATFGAFDASFKASIWDLESRERIAVMDMPVGWNTQAFSSDFALGAFGTSGIDALLVFDTSTGERVAELVEPGAIARSMTFSSDDTRLAAVHQDGTLFIFDTSTWTVIEKVDVGESFVRAVRYSPDGRFLATFVDDGDVLLLDAATHELVKTLVGPGRDGVTTSDAVFFDENSQYMITSSGRMWDLDAGVQIGAGFPNEPDFRIGGKDGFELLTAEGEFIRRWNLNLDEWPDIACRAAGRNLTFDEWEQFAPDGESYRATCPEWPAATD